MEAGNDAVRGTWYVVRGGQFESSALCAMAHFGISTDHWPQATCLFSNPHPTSYNLAKGFCGASGAAVVGCFLRFR